MWAFQCNLDKIIIFSSFLVVFIICLLLLSEESRDYTKWLKDKVRDEDLADSPLQEKVLLSIKDNIMLHSVSRRSVSSAW